MTVRDFLYISWLSYLDLPELYQSLLKRGGSIPVAAFADSILRMDAAGLLPCRELNQAARDAARYMKNNSCLITGYINQNPNDGFVAYTLACENEIIVAMRGSENANECVPSNIDWTDNFCEPFSGSVQQLSIEKLISALPKDTLVTYTGHSKGGHNAMLALSLDANENRRAIAFNGQGFSAENLTAEQISRLSDRAVNYVTSSDIVGAILLHPERRIFVKPAPSVNPHMPDAYIFTPTGTPVRSLRTPASLAADIAARAADSALSRRFRRRTDSLCRFFTRAARLSN